MGGKICSRTTINPTPPNHTQKLSTIPLFTTLLHYFCAYDRIGETGRKSGKSGKEEQREDACSDSQIYRAGYYKRTKEAEEMTIYPQIDHTKKEDGTIEFRTTLRKKHLDGKWYLQYFYQRTSAPADFAIHRLHVEVYHTLISGIVSPESRDAWGAPTFPLDEDQREESERLKEVFAV